MARKSKLPLGSKAAFVRANPGATAREIVELGEQQGMSLTVGHVYNIRAEDKKKRDQGSSEASTLDGSTSNTSSSLSAKAPPQLEAQLRTLVIRIGLDRAEQVFEQLKSTLARMG
jgi:hypothetical protein